MHPLQYVRYEREYMNPASERRLAENELIFKKRNERIKARVEKLLNQMDETAMKIQFYCECSNEDCRKKIAITPQDYELIHKNARHFLIAGGHNIETVENVIEKAETYWVVEKMLDPPSTTNMELNPTSS
jgi:hypothetical protein